MHRCVSCDSTEADNKMSSLGLHRPINGFIRDPITLDFYCDQCYNEIQESMFEEEEVIAYIYDDDEIPEVIIKDEDSEDK